MTTLARKITRTERCVCPTCETEWLRNADGTWWCDPDWGRRGYDRYYKDPTADGRSFCPVCAVNTATHADRLRYVAREEKQREFLRWVLESEDDAIDCFRALLAPDPDWLEQRLAGFVTDKCESDFADWRCGS